MGAKAFQNDTEQALEVAFEPRNQYDWVVQEDPQLQDELNRILKSGEEVNSLVVNKVLDRIKDL
ncbi:MAG: hypothetical protein AB8I40_08295 [Anaerolineales bacterium]